MIKNQVVKIKTESKIMNDLIIASIICLPLINNIIVDILKTTIGISFPLMIIFLIYTFSENRFYVSYFQVILSLICIITFLFSFVFFGLNIYNTQYFLNYIYYGILPIMFINNKHDNDRIIRIISYISIAAIIMISSREFDVYEYSNNMKYSNMLVPGGLAIMYQAFIKKNTNIIFRIINIIIFIIYITLMLKWGTRGSMLAVILYPLIILISHASKIRKAIIIIFLIIGCIFLLVNLRSILLFFDDTLSSFNIQYLALNRAITLINYGNLSNNRLEIWKLAIESIFSLKFLSKGISTFEIINENYTHNIFLQLLIEFGPCLGLIFGLGVIFLFTKIIIINNRENEKELAILMAASSLVVLQFTSIHWNFVTFWIFIYESYNIIFNKNMSKVDKNIYN